MFILFKIDVYFLKLNLTVQIDEKAPTEKDLIFEEKRQEVLETKTCELWTLLELVQVKKVMMQIVKLVEYKH